MSKLWKPDNAGKVVPLVRVRPLLPPPPQASVRLQPQHLHWQLGRYVEDLSFGPGGRGKRRRWVVDREAEQHNIVLNQTYDSLMPQYGIIGLHRWAAVGTGSTPPNAGQLGLVNEVARTQTNELGQNGTWGLQLVAPGVYDISVVREFTEQQVGNLNLSEWGFSPSGQSGPNLMSRELFRDGNGTPIVITPDSDQRLRLIYAIRITLSPASPTPASIDISGLGVFTGKCMATLSPGGLSIGPTWIDLATVETVLTGTVLNKPHVNSETDKLYLAVDRLPLVYDSGQTSTVATAKPYTVGPVSNRTRQTNQVVFSASEANHTVRTIGLGQTAGAWRFVFDQGQEFTKTNLYKLTIGPWTLTWGP